MAEYYIVVKDDDQLNKAFEYKEKNRKIKQIVFSLGNLIYKISEEI